jgi:multiple sugar transport system ATP-binding protein
MDEPLSNLDALLRSQTREELLRLHRGIDSTVVYVTHDQVEAMTMGDRIAVMRDGRVEQVGMPRDVYRRPVNRFVAGFLGTPPMNFLAGEVAELEAGLAFRTAGGHIALDVERGWRAPPGAATVGIRPEHVIVKPAAGREASTHWWVDLIEDFGTDRIVLVRSGDIAVRTRVGFGHELAEGTPVDLEADAGELHFFSREGVALAYGQRAESRT